MPAPRKVQQLPGPELKAKGAPSSSPLDAARGLWARAVGNAHTPAELAAAIDQMCAQLHLGLRRWIGAEGFRALLARALSEVQAEHPVLRGLACVGEGGSKTADAVRLQGPAAMGAAMVAVVGALIELLGRIIGGEMALRLVEQIEMPGPPQVLGTLSKADRNG
jgi:hypothetical protein